MIFLIKKTCFPILKKKFSTVLLLTTRSCPRYTVKENLLKKDFIYLFLEREEGGKREKERNINRLLLAHPEWKAWLATKACVLPGNQTSNFRFVGQHPAHWATSAKVKDNLDVNSAANTSFLESEMIYKPEV